MRKTIFYSIIILIIILISIVNTDLFRFNVERISSMGKIETSVSQKAARDPSAKRRIFDEIETTKKVLKSDNFLLGYGLNYAKYLPERKLGLNTITEVLIRWGIFGIIIFLVAFINELSKSRSIFFYLFCFLILYFTVDGAIAKASYWTFLGLVFLFNRIHNNQISPGK